MRRRRRTTKRTSRSTRIAAAATLALLVPLTACSDDDNGMGPEATGSVEAAVMDGGAGSTADVVGGTRASVSSASADGSFRADARVEVSLDGDSWVDIGETSDLDVALQSGEAQTVGTADLAAQTYSKVRVVLTNAEAEVLAGSTIGAGPISADLTIDVDGGADGQVVLEFDRSITVRADERTELLFDLNSGAWLDDQAIQAGAVSEAEVQSAASLTVQ